MSSAKPAWTVLVMVAAVYLTVVAVMARDGTPGWGTSMGGRALAAGCRLRVAAIAKPWRWQVHER